MYIQKIIITILLIIQSIFSAGNHHLYVRESICLDVDNEKYTFADNTENLWGYYIDREFDVGNEYTLIMDDKGTSSIYDDSIIMIAKGIHNYDLPVAIPNYKNPEELKTIK